MLRANSKIIVEIKINENLCNVEKDSRLSKEMVCYQLGKRLENALDLSVMTLLIKDFDDIKESLVININNHQAYKMSKKDADRIKQVIAKELGAYIQNPSKEIAQNLLSDEKRGGAVLALLRQNGAALAFKQEGDKSRYETDAIEDYKIRCEQHEAYLKSREINKEIKANYNIYNLFTTTDDSNLRPKFYYQMTRYDVPCLWFSHTTDPKKILAITDFIQFFAWQSTITYKDTAVSKICQVLGAKEYVEELAVTEEFISTTSQYQIWARPMIKGFLKRNLWFSDEKSVADKPMSSDDINWLNQFEGFLYALFQNETMKVKTILINKII